MQNKTQKFYLIRHGETEWNKLRKLQGHSDIPLNDTGREQAKQLSATLKGLGVEKVFSSDLSRAFETASIACRFIPDIAPVKDRRLRELYLGDAEGMTRDELITNYGAEHVAEWNSHQFPDNRIDIGESKRELFLRVYDLVLESLGRHPGQTLAFFTHGIVIRTFAHMNETRLVDPYYVPNCGVSEFIYDTEEPSAQNPTGLSRILGPVPLNFKYPRELN